MPMGWNRIQENGTNETREKTHISPNFESGKDKDIKSDNNDVTRTEVFIPQTPQRNLDDVILPKITRERIEAALNRIRYHDKLYNEWNLKKIDPSGCRVALNFFGQPGTGKTSCAEAIAKLLNKQIITVNYAEIESKYVGETPKNITAAFRQAKETDSILFFDEADSILGKRLTSVTQSADHGVNVSRSVMLLQLDSFDGIVIFATNLPENFDGAFVRRILAHIEFELPDKDCLFQLWQYLLPNEIPRTDDVTLDWLTSQSIGLAGGDILNVVKLAASKAVARTVDKCKVSQQDLLEAIYQVRNGKEQIGSTLSKNKIIAVKETTLTRDELNPDIKERYDAAVAQ
ncbi:AAA ATPase central domain-containing protein [Kalymmatonema gypsitolerans NIES-4073]|nr:AAA ATPase central domain-containing protein [Scytonema sp. NIES-4073]